jgi:NAD(P)-dependent dehydrogenase (short-subunit alcohol dehydrogenase family)
MSRWTAAQLPSYAGKTVVVTGANSGIGQVAAAEFAAHGAQVVLACRSLGKAERAAQQMRPSGGDVRVEKLDLSSLDSVAAFADRWSDPLDLLVNNAGVMTPPSWMPTAEGFELQFGTNHLGHMALTSALMPWLLKADTPRVVTISSIAHHGGGRDVIEGNPVESYEPMPSYRNSKLANLLFARELQRRANHRGLSLTSTAAHPGVAATSLFTDAQGGGANPVIRHVLPVLLPLLLASPEAGAQATLYAAAVAEPGSYSGPRSRREWRGPVGAARLSPLAADDDLAAALWDRSEEMLGTPFAWR